MKLKNILYKKNYNNDNKAIATINMNKIFMVVLISSMLFNIINLYALKINKIDVKPENRVLIYLDETITFKSKLTNDKSKVEILLENVYFDDSVKDLYFNNNFITNINTFNNGTQTITSINLTKPLGYTANYLPYSKSIFIEVFEWDKIKPSEDAFRNGLLALESGLVDNSIQELQTASSLNSKNSFAFLGLVQLQNGYFDQGYRNLIIAFENKSDVPDAYAALAQIYKAKNEVQTANKFSKIFTSLTGINYFDEIVIDPDQINLINNLNLNYLDNFQVESEKIEIDTTKIISLQDSIPKDSTQTTNSEFLPSVFFSYLAGVLFLIGGFIIILIINKKRKSNKINYAKEKFKHSLQNEMDNLDPNKFAKQSEIKKQIAKRKKEIETQHTKANTKKITDIYNQKPSINLKDLPYNISKDDTKNVEIDNNSDKIENFLKDFIEAKKREEKSNKEVKKNKQNNNNTKNYNSKNNDFNNKLYNTKFEEKLNNQKDFEKSNQKNEKLNNNDNLAQFDNNDSKKVDAKTELAIHLLQKQKEMDLLKSKDETISKNSSIEKNGLDTIKTLENLNNDKSKIDEIKNKFKNDDI